LKRDLGRWVPETHEWIEDDVAWAATRQDAGLNQIGRKGGKNERLLKRLGSYIPNTPLIGSRASK